MSNHKIYVTIAALIIGGALGIGGTLYGETLRIPQKHSAELRIALDGRQSVEWDASGQIFRCDESNECKDGTFNIGAMFNKRLDYAKVAIEKARM